MAAGAHLVQRGQVGDAPQVRDAAGVHDGRADVVDQLVLDQVLAVPDRVEHLADRQRRRGVLADQAERLLVLGRRRVLHPEQAVGLERLAQPRRLDRRQPVVHVVQQVRARSRTSRARASNSLGTWRRYLSRVDQSCLGRQVGVGRLVEQLAAAADAVGLVQPGHAALRADRLVAHARCSAAPRRPSRAMSRAVGVAVDHARRSRLVPPSNWYSGMPASLGLDVPQRGVDRGDRAHRHRPAPPVGAAVEVLPDVLDPVRVAADQAGDHVVCRGRPRPPARGR